MSVGWKPNTNLVILFCDTCILKSMCILSVFIEGRPRYYPDMKHTFVGLYTGVLLTLQDKKKLYKISSWYQLELYLFFVLPIICAYMSSYWQTVTRLLYWDQAVCVYFLRYFGENFNNIKVWVKV